MSSEATIKEGIVKCVNNTAGEAAYQMFCVSNQNTAGSCSTLPAIYIPNNHIDCTNVTSTAFLQYYLSSTGNACGINCFYLPANGTSTNTTGTPSSLAPVASHTSVASHSQFDPFVLFISVFAILYLFLHNKLL